MNGDTMDNGSSGRRSFLTRLGASVVGTIVAIFPFAAGLGVFTDPLRRRSGLKDDDKSETADFARICPLESLPADGVPHAFAVSTAVFDAWTRAAEQRIGEVFLIRSNADDKAHVTAFTATCPHLGCAVEFIAAEDRFECPCHESAFAKNGEQLFGPSRRGLDPLEVKLVDATGGKEVWVAFQRFRAGVAERIPVG